MSEKNNAIHVKSDRIRYDSAHSEYAFQMRYRRFPWWWLLLLLLPLIFVLLFIPIKKDVTVHVVYTDGTPVDSAMVTLNVEQYHLWEAQQLPALTKYTSPEGTAVFRQLVDYPFWMIVRPHAEAVVLGQKGFLAGKGSFKFHWTKQYTLVLDGELVVEVRSRATGEPIPGAAVSLNVSDMENRRMQLTTDEEGLARYSIHDPEGKIDTLIVTKYGYSGYREVDSGYATIPDLHRIVYLDPPKRCGWLANNETNTEALTILDYDMGQVGGTARFSYYTEAARDIIEVYDGTSSEYAAGTARLLFRCDWATFTDAPRDFVMLQFSGQYLCVVVQKLSYYWGYLLSCP
jgi:hypothetical protein